jgi:hypothetical protein
MSRLMPSSLTPLLGALALCLPLAASAEPASLEKAEVHHLDREVPHDIDPSLYKKLLEEKHYARLERAFDLHAWRSFIAINWPLDAAGKARPSLSDSGQPRWMGWKEAYEVFRCDGGKPAPWGSPRAFPGTCDQNQVLASLPGAAAAEGKSTRILFLSNKMKNVVDEVDQAFTGPLWDQNGNLVRYEVLMNQDEFNYIVDDKNQLYNLDGQIRFAQKHDKADFPSGDFHGKAEGAIEIKLAWKVLDPAKGDIPERFVTTEAWVYENNGWRKQAMGLVGFHISQKTKTAPQWIWSTFEQVDNLQVNALEEVTVKGKKVQLKPSFNDPSCETCPINTFVQGKPAQVHRMIPIPLATAQLNREMQALLRSQGSRLQYYELIGTQYPLDATAPPTTPGKSNLPYSITNKPGGHPNRAYLTNMTMETYFQKGNQQATNLQENNPPDTTIVFGTESCMGCHSSAGIATGYTVNKDGTKTAVFNGQLTADFSWLLQERAQWKAAPPVTVSKPIP